MQTDTRLLYLNCNEYKSIYFLEHYRKSLNVRMWLAKVRLAGMEAIFSFKTVNTHIRLLPLNCDCTNATKTVLLARATAVSVPYTLLFMHDPGLCKPQKNKKRYM